MPELFESHTRRSIDKKWIIGVVAFVVLAAAGYGVYRWSIPTGPDPDSVLAAEIRDSVVLLLDFERFSGEEFRQQVLGRGRLEAYKRAIDEAIYTYPASDEAEFDAFLRDNFYDRDKIEFGTVTDGILSLGDYKVAVSDRFARMFRTKKRNIRVDHRRTLSFQFATVTYDPSLKELSDLTNNTQVHGGRMITQIPERSFRQNTVFANHGIMVAKPGEPSLKRLADNLTGEAGGDRFARIQALVDFVANEIEYSYSEALSGRETLKRGSETLMTRNGDCSNKTILLASLLEQIGEEYILLYTPKHITVAVPQGDLVNANGLDFTWDGKPWLIAETTVPGFRVGQTNVTEPRLLTTVESVQNPKNAGTIFDANSLEVLKFL